MITISTGQFWTLGTVGLILLVAIAAVVIRLAETFIIRTVVLVLALVFLLGCWFQRGAIGQSVRHCDPHVLFVRIRIDDPRTLAVCREVTQPGPPGKPSGGKR